MLIVVAIIAILIAISIPTVNAALEKSRKAVDDANQRAAIGLGNIYYLTEYTGTADVTKFYKADANHQGSLIDTADANTAAGDADSANVTAPTVKIGKSSGQVGYYLKVVITSGGTVTATFVNATS